MSRQLLLVVLAVINLDVVIGNCTFPLYTTRYPRWETRISLERYKIGAYWTFNQTTANFTDLLTQKQNSYQYTCETEVSPYVFVMKLQLQRDPNKLPLQNDQSTIDTDLKDYMCVQFFEHSTSILQLKVSQLSVLAPKETLCGGDQSSWDNQILVWPRMENYEACPITGGFQFSMTDHSIGIKLCANSYLPPAFESECLKDEGINIDFRNFQCRGELGMQVNQRLLCLGNWVEGNFTFSVTTNQDETWPRLWMLRLPLQMQDHFDAELLTEIKVVTTEVIELSSDHYTLHMNRTQFASTCEDEAVDCNNCNNNTMQYCQKSCGACLSSVPSNYSTTTIGSWLQVSSSGTKMVNISTSAMTVGNISFPFLSLAMKNGYTTKDRRALTMTFYNGCRPRYLCADFVPKGDSVLQYRLSQYVMWPHSLPMTADDLCNDDLFSESKTQAAPTSNPGTHKYKAIVKSEESPPSTTQCGFIRGHFHLTAHLPFGSNCTALLDTCNSESETSFQLVKSSDCDDRFNVGTEHQCLASFRDETNEDLVVITGTGGVNAFYCWVLHKEEWESRPRLFLTYAADCNSDIIKYILYRNYTRYLAHFEIAAGPGYLGTYSCLEDTSSLFNLSKTTTLPKSTTSLLSNTTQDILSNTSARSTHQSTKATQSPLQNSQLNQGQPCIPANNMLAFFTAMFCVVSVLM